MYVLEAKDLVSSEAAEAMDTFVRIYLVPDEKSNNGPLQTKVALTGNHLKHSLTLILKPFRSSKTPAALVIKRHSVSGSIKRQTDN